MASVGRVEPAARLLLEEGIVACLAAAVSRFSSAQQEPQEHTAGAVQACCVALAALASSGRAVRVAVTRARGLEALQMASRPQWHRTHRSQHASKALPAICNQAAPAFSPPGAHSVRSAPSFLLQAMTMNTTIDRALRTAFPALEPWLSGRERYGLRCGRAGLGKLCSK